MPDMASHDFAPLGRTPAPESSTGARSPELPRIAVFSGPQSTVGNNAPVVTGDKARVAAGFPPRTDPAVTENKHYVGPRRKYRGVHVGFHQHRQEPYKREEGSKKRNPTA